MSNNLKEVKISAALRQSQDEEKDCGLGVEPLWLGPELF